MSVAAAFAMATDPEEEEHVSRQVVYEATTSSSRNIGAIIAIIVVALALIAFILVQLKQRPPHRSSELRHERSEIAQVSLDRPSPWSTGS
jgi:hypothetical protein